MYEKKIDSLREIISSQIAPLIQEDFTFLDLPYYDNIGDTLIWEGTLNFLESLRSKCLYSASLATFQSSKMNSSRGTILLQGGGNFGNLWRAHQDFRLEIIQRYPNHKIIILPQTIYYSNIDMLKADADIMASHPNLYICARDYRSMKLLETYFPKNNRLLVPDMAFFIPSDSLNKYRLKERPKTLILKRSDKELSDSSLPEFGDLEPPVDFRDWPTLEGKTHISKMFRRIYRLKRFSMNFVDWYAKNVLKRQLVKTGVQFVSGYRDIYTTRLHVAILSILLHKEFYFIDNSYGKNSTFYDTWLTDLDGATFLSNPDLNLESNKVNAKEALK